jgi:hypothetical protein
MSRTLRPPAALAIVAMVAVISASCGGTSSRGDTSTAAPAATTGTASRSGTASSASAGGDPNAAARNNAVKFADCMRENGVSDFPDPNASGDFPGFGASVSLEEWRQAIGACKDLQPPIVRNPEQQSTALEFARCIRENGVKDFPDPVNGAPLVGRTRIPSTATPGGTSALNAAMEACRDLLREISAEAAGG